MNGYLKTVNLKSSFSITGAEDSFTPTVPPAAPATADTLVDAGQVGGNTEPINSFTVVDIGNLNGGIFNVVTLLEGNNLAYFSLQVLQIGISTTLATVISDFIAVPSWGLVQLSPVTSHLAFPQLEALEIERFATIPGAAIPSFDTTENMPKPTKGYQSESDRHGAKRTKKHRIVKEKKRAVPNGIKTEEKHRAYQEKDDR
ncbi:hypothetical protein DID88_001956 [Monilinia fructigena]|uniref:Uncharacterized protein n=1 Tax=Monilinia fructigena TaxID=38457 RepID=A0A395IW18_9HELO|nr:hypothetical protein DID88_001956 [Monilinia fructigena]